MHCKRVIAAKSTVSLYMHSPICPFFFFLLESLLSIYLYTPSPASEFCDYTRFYVVILKEIMPFSLVRLRTEGLRDGGDAICLLSWGAELGPRESVRTWSSLGHWWLSQAGLALRRRLARRQAFSAEPSFRAVARRFWHFPNSGIGNPPEFASQVLIYSF